MRCRAEDLQKEQLRPLLENGEISYAPPKNTRGFSINDCIPIVPDAGQLNDAEVEQRIAGMQEQLERLRLAYPVYGITVLAYVRTAPSFFDIQPEAFSGISYFKILKNRCIFTPFHNIFKPKRQLSACKYKIKNHKPPKRVYETSRRGNSDPHSG